MKIKRGLTPLVSARRQWMHGVRPLLGFLLFSVGATSAVAADEMAALRTAFLRGEYETVVSQSGALAGRHDLPQDEMLYLRGISALKLRDWELARGALNRLVTEHPGSRWAPQGWMGLAEGWAAAGNEGEAIRLYGSLLEEDRAGPLAPQAAFRLAELERQAGRWEQARAGLQAVVRQAPGSPESEVARQILEGEAFYFTVQVGAFASRSNAVKLEAELRRRGYQPEVSQTDANGRLFHRVRVGRFTSRQEAEAQQHRLQEDGFPGRIFP